MPRNGSGTYDRAVSDYVFDTVISETDVNSEMDDIATALSASIAKDGQTTTTARIPFASGISADTIAEITTATGVTIDSVLLKDGRIDTTQGADISSSATVNLEAATGNVVDVTGTTTITAITLSQGHWRWVRFTGALTLTHGASLVLPGAADITTVAGDYALFVGYASSVVRCAAYLRGATLPGDVSGPASSTDEALARFDGTDGKTLQDSGWTLDNSDVLTAGGKLAMADEELERPVFKDYGETVNAIGSTGGGTQDIDLTLGNVVTATVDTSANTFTFSNPSASGTACSFTLILTNGGSQTVNWPASVTWAGGDAPTLTTSGVDVLTFLTVNGGTTWRGFAAGLDMS